MVSRVRRWWSGPARVWAVVFVASVLHATAIAWLTLNVGSDLVSFAAMAVPPLALLWWRKPAARRLDLRWPVLWLLTYIVIPVFSWATLVAGQTWLFSHVWLHGDGQGEAEPDQGRTPSPR